MHLKRLLTALTLGLALILTLGWVLSQSPRPKTVRAAGVLVINEIQADPAADLSGDANGDGARDATEDEFIEIVNTGPTQADLSGWTLNDPIGVQHTFTANTIIPAGCALVIFGGGTPTGDFGQSVVLTASTGNLSLNNTGDVMTLFDLTATPVVSYAYGSEGNDDQSLTRNPDITGPEPLVRHSTITAANGALFSPGTRIDGAPFAGCVASPALALTKQAQPNTAVRPQGEVTYTIVLRNNGSASANNTVLTDTLPDQVEFARWLAQPAGANLTSNQLTWSGAVSAGQALTFTFIVTNQATSGVITNTAHYSHASSANSASASFSVTVDGAPPDSDYIIYLPLVLK